MLGVDATGDAAQRIGGKAQVLGGQLGLRVAWLQEAVEGGTAVGQGCAMAGLGGKGRAMSVVQAGRDLDGEAVDQGREAGAGLGRNGKGSGRLNCRGQTPELSAGFICGRWGWGAGPEVAFVQDDQEAVWGWGKAGGRRPNGGRGVDQPDDQIGLASALDRAADAFLFDRARGFAQAGRIGNNDRVPAKVQVGFEDVPGSAGLGGNDGDVAAGKGIE